MQSTTASGVAKRLKREMAYDWFFFIKVKCFVVKISARAAYLDYWMLRNDCWENKNLFQVPSISPPVTTVIVTIIVIKQGTGRYWTMLSVVSHCSYSVRLMICLHALTGSLGPRAFSSRYNTVLTLRYTTLSCKWFANSQCTIHYF